MGALGWSPAEADLMELWQVGMFLGPDGADPVIRGSRHLTLDRQATPGPSGRPIDPNVAARLRAHEARQAAAREAEQ